VLKLDDGQIIVKQIFFAVGDVLKTETNKLPFPKFADMLSQNDGGHFVR
jgi:hypothetical protein